MSGNNEQTVKVIDIKHSYSENQECNYKDIPISQHIQDIQQIDNSYSRFEVITEKTRKLFFSIQGIDINDTELIFKIVEELKKKLIEFFAIAMYQYNGKKYSVDVCNTYLRRSKHYIDDFDVIITENVRKDYAGRSYHVIFCNACIYGKFNTIKAMKDFINFYISTKSIGYQYIDNSIYYNGSLFRCINQPGVNMNTSDNEACLLNDDMYKVIYCNLCRTDDSLNDDECLKDILTMSSLNYFQFDEKSGWYKSCYKMFCENCLYLYDYKINDEKMFSIFEERAEQQKGENEYNKAAILSYVYKDDLNTNMQTALKSIVEYYNKNKNFDNFELNIKQIQILESMIENKL